MWKRAFSLSKAEVQAATPPGTIKIFHEQETGHVPGFIKFPRPSTEARDPLNFSRGRKIGALLVASVFAFVANFNSSVIAPALQIWPMAFPNDQRSYAERTYLIAVNILFLGVANIVWVPLSNWLGRRPTLLMATLLMTLCSLWCGLATSYNSLIAARILQGFGGGAADTVAPALIGDLYFVHQRGRAMALYTVMLCVGPVGGGLAGGYIAFQRGWSAIFWVSTGLSALCLLGVALFVPETLFQRADVPAESTSEPGDEKHTMAEQIENSESTTHTGKLSYVQSLGFISPHGSLIHHLKQPWRAASLPGTWVVMLHYAGLVGGVVTISTIGAQLMASPPYLWGPNAGLINIGSLIGAVLGWGYTHLLSDSRLKSHARKMHGGMAEAEDRLPTMFLPLAIATGGFFVFGFCADSPGGTRWVGLQVGYGMVTFGLMQVPSVGFNYLIDSYGPRAADCFTVVTILRSIVAFAWSFFAAEWVHDKGAAEPFGIFGMLMGLFALLTVPLWLYGKRMRIATEEQVKRWNSE
ncbi:major facilitator superfamily domain-containing protein [Plectosphaerella plurivora]|uniref:Major facilitator superfamily domain-containing protein n=1 Tax=Plectosphaerella plurivora TaxID=936078 RepID=A0A9P8V3I5_9PEZI|nr:major facilitator superfamily domain-containing protein [Plectosphaerella plurivora]